MYRPKKSKKPVCGSQRQETVLVADYTTADMGVLVFDVVLVADCTTEVLMNGRWFTDTDHPDTDTVMPDGGERE